MTDQQWVTKRIHTIKLWVKAFIPSTYAGAEVVQVGEHKGKAMLTALWVVNRCFLTDERIFSPELHAEARMHSEIEIDVIKKKMVYEFHHCYDTVEIDCATGAEKCRDKGGTDNMRFEHFVAAESGQTFTVDLNASSKNPCLKVANVKVSPNIDLYGTITVTMSEDISSATIRFDGMVETYPAFEMYAAFNGSETGKPVFQVDVEEGATVASITGAPTREVHAEVVIAL